MATEIGQVYHNLSTLLDSGVPISRSLGIVIAPLSGKVKKGFLSLQEGVLKGHTLSETMAKHPGIFASLDVMIVKAADISGNLPQSLKLLSKWYDFLRRLKRIIISGLMLPFVVLHIAAIVGPLPALFLGASTSGQYLLEVIATLALFYVPAVIIYVVFFLTPRKGPARRALDFFLLKIPLLGRAILYLSLSRFCRSFYMLFSAGVPITECAETAGDVTGNITVRNFLKGGIKSTYDGNMLCEGFSARLPEDFVNIWRIGEESGELEKVIKRLSDNTADTGEYLLKELCRWVPRIIYFLICALIIIQVLRNAAMIGYGISSITP